MIVVRNVFVATPGNASKLAAQIKAAGVAAEMPDYRVLTDVTGDFNRVVLEYEVASLAELERRMEEYGSNDALQEAMKGYHDLFITGHRELLRTV